MPVIRSPIFGNLWFRLFADDQTADDLRPKYKSLGPKARLDLRWMTALLRFQGFDHHEFAHLAPVFETNVAGDLGKQGVVLTAANVEPRLHARAALPHDDRPAGH